VRALVEVSCKKLSIRSGVAETDIAKFENHSWTLSAADREALKDALGQCLYPRTMAGAPVFA
jgi:hypothetical protein